MKKLILFVSLFLLIPSVCNAAMNQLTLNKVELYNNSTFYTRTTTISKWTNSQIDFSGYAYTQSTAQVFPYNRVLFYFTSDYEDTYDFTFLINSSFLRDDGYATATFNNMPCSLINSEGYITFWSCPNVYVFEGSNNNIIRFYFANSGASSTGFNYGISLVRGDLNNSNSNNEILTWVKYYSERTQSLIRQQQDEIINNQNENTQKEIENANNNHKETMDTITSSDVDSDGISSLTSTDLPSSGPLTSILNMPIVFFNSLISNLGSNSCLTFTVPLPFIDSTFTFPCIRDLLRELGALTFYNLIGDIVSGIALFNYLLYMGHQFKRMEEAKEGNAEFGGL